LCLRNSVTRLPREAMIVALPRKVDTMLPLAAERTLPRTNLARVEPNRSGTLSRGKGISVCCALSVETVLCLINSHTRLPRAIDTQLKRLVEERESLEWEYSGVQRRATESTRMKIESVVGRRLPQEVSS
jgi:hypothetical protein